MHIITLQDDCLHCILRSYTDGHHDTLFHPESSVMGHVT